MVHNMRNCIKGGAALERLRTIELEKEPQRGSDFFPCRINQPCARSINLKCYLDIRNKIPSLSLKESVKFSSCLSFN